MVRYGAHYYVVGKKVRFHWETNFLSRALENGLNLDMWLYLGVGNSVKKSTEARKPLRITGYLVWPKNPVCEEE